MRVFNVTITYRYSERERNTYGKFADKSMGSLMERLALIHSDAYEIKVTDEGLIQ